MYKVQRHFWVNGSPMVDSHSCICPDIASAKYRGEWLAESFGSESCFYITEVEGGALVSILNIFSLGRFSWSDQ
jgi:hypothetical protein